ncbi:hypothetical protein F5Y17DRAFT_51151 [Xylariaceae sp. FL0594]|nr:hypothetical protein F5Y17DRAFT_51151 [Xylariaceae sp. FL0594]
MVEVPGHLDPASPLPINTPSYSPITFTTSLPLSSTEPYGFKKSSKPHPQIFLSRSFIKGILDWILTSPSEQHMPFPRYNRAPIQDIARPDYRTRESFEMVPWDPNGRSLRKTTDKEMSSHCSRLPCERRCTSLGFAGSQADGDHVTSREVIPQWKSRVALQGDRPERTGLRRSTRRGSDSHDVRNRAGRVQSESLTYLRPRVPGRPEASRSSNAIPPAHEKRSLAMAKYDTSPVRISSQAGSWHEVQWEAADDHFGISSRESSPALGRPVHRQTLSSGSKPGEGNGRYLPEAPFPERLPTPDFDSERSCKGSRTPTPEFCACFSNGQCSHREQATYEEARRKMDKQRMFHELNLMSRVERG